MVFNVKIMITKCRIAKTWGNAQDDSVHMVSMKSNEALLCFQYWMVIS